MLIVFRSIAINVIALLGLKNKVKQRIHINVLVSVAIILGICIVHKLFDSRNKLRRIQTNRTISSKVGLISVDPVIHQFQSIRLSQIDIKHVHVHGLVIQNREILGTIVVEGTMGKDLRIRFHLAHGQWL